MGQELNLGSHHAVELQLDWVRCFLTVLLIKNKPRFHWHFLGLAGLAMVLAVLFKELLDIRIKVKFDPMQLLNLKFQKLERVHEDHDLATGNFQVCSIELLKIQLELFRGLDGCEIVYKYSKEDELLPSHFMNTRDGGTTP